MADGLSLNGLQARNPASYTHTIATGKTVEIVPLVLDVTVAIASGGAAAVAASGKDVTLTVKSDDTTTVTAMNALIAASATVSPLIGALVGTGADTFDHTKTLAATKLYRESEVSGAAVFGINVAGKFVPFKLTSDGELSIAATVSDIVTNRPYLPVAGAAATEEVGVTGRMNKDITLTIDSGMTAGVHPKQNGVSVAVTTGAAAAVSASGKAVTLTAKNAPALTTIADMNVLIAASSSVSALIGALTGTGTDTFDAAVSIAATDCWASGTIPANLMCALGSDGYIWPVEMDSTGGIKMSMSSLLFSEDGSRSTMRVEQQGTSSGWLAASTAVVAAGTAGRAYNVSFLVSGGAGATMNIRDDGVIGGAIRRQFVFTADGYYYYELGDMPYGNGLYVEKNAGTCSFDIIYRNG